MRWVKRLQQEYVTGGTKAFLDELLHKRANGDTSLETTISISFAYENSQQPTEAEIFAREALQTIQAGDLLHKRDRHVRVACDMAHMALANAWTAQGRFIEAAAFLNDFIPAAHESNNVTAFAAWLYFLGRDHANARALLAQVRPPGRQPHRTIPLHVQFLVAYLRHALLDQDTRADLKLLRIQMQIWNARLYNARNTPYGARLDAIMADITQLIPLGWYYRAAHRRRAGEAAQLQTECESKRATGDSSYQTALLLAEAYAYQGYGAEAELPAREAFASIQHGGHCDQTDEDARFLCDVAYLAVCNALGMQGRYVEAAEFLAPRADKAEKTNFMHLMVAWYWFLAGDDDQARACFARLKPLAPTPARTLTLKYVLLAAYLQHKLTGQAAGEQLRVLSGFLKDWDEDIARWVPNPYRERIAAMLAEIRALVG